MHDDHEAFEDSLSEMLHDRAATLRTAADPIGATRRDLAHARRRRRVALSATAVLVVAGGAAAGNQALGSVGGTSKASVASGSTTSTTPAHAADSTPPSADRQHPVEPRRELDCTPIADKPYSYDASTYPEALRGSLAPDTALNDQVLARAKSLIPSTFAKVVYSGEDTSTRVVVVFLNPVDINGCGKDLRVVVFHGPAGTAAADLSAQSGHWFWGANVGFTWAQRNADGTITSLVLDPSAAKTLTPAGDMVTGAQGQWASIDTLDGTYLHTYAVGQHLPETYSFPSPNGYDSGSYQSFTVTAQTKQAYAFAVGVNPGQVHGEAGKTDKFGLTDPAAFSVGPETGNVLFPTTPGDGLENVYWTDFVQNTQSSS